MLSSYIHKLYACSTISIGSTDPECKFVHMVDIMFILYLYAISIFILCIIFIPHFIKPIQRDCYFGCYIVVMIPLHMHPKPNKEQMVGRCFALHFNYCGHFQTKKNEIIPKKWWCCALCKGWISKNAADLKPNKNYEFVQQLRRLVTCATATYGIKYTYTIYIHCIINDIIYIYGKPNWRIE